jgi:hypothetical protein
MGVIHFDRDHVCRCRIIHKLRNGCLPGQEVKGSPRAEAAYQCQLVEARGLAAPIRPSRTHIHSRCGTSLPDQTKVHAFGPDVVAE